MVRVYCHEVTGAYFVYYNTLGRYSKKEDCSLHFKVADAEKLQITPTYAWFFRNNGWIHKCLSRVAVLITTSEKEKRPSGSKRIVCILQIELTGVCSNSFEGYYVYNYDQVTEKVTRVFFTKSGGNKDLSVIKSTLFKLYTDSNKLINRLNGRFLVVTNPALDTTQNIIVQFKLGQSGLYPHGISLKSRTGKPKDGKLTPVTRYRYGKAFRRTWSLQE